MTPLSRAELMNDVMFRDGRGRSRTAALGRPSRMADAGNACLRRSGSGVTGKSSLPSGPRSARRSRSTGASPRPASSSRARSIRLGCADNQRMQQRDGSILFSPSDLNAFLECEHLTQLELAVARHELERPTDENPQADLVKRKGEEHEAAYLAQLVADGREVTTIANDWDLDVAARATKEAMLGGADVVYQACFVDGDWRGFADFVERQ